MPNDDPTPRSPLFGRDPDVDVTAGLESAEDGRSTPEVTAGAATANLLVARPGGLAATVLGIAIFVVGLPFTLINGSTEQAAQQLVVNPASLYLCASLGTGHRGLGEPETIELHTPSWVMVY